MRFTVPLAVLLLVLGFSSAGAFAPVAADRAQGVPPGIEVVSSDEHGMSLVFELEELVTANASVGGEEFQVLSIPGGGFSGEVGAPAIPTFARFVPVPEGATVEVRAVPLEEEEIAGVRLIPVQAGDGSEFAYDPEAYGSTVTDAVPRAQVGRSVKFRDLPVAALTFRPVRYDPVRRTALVARGLKPCVCASNSTASS